MEIYYFSGTGNSLFVAKALSKRLNAKLVPITKAKLPITSKTIGLVFPLYFMGLPVIVKKFVESANFSDADYVFAVVTRGADFAGGPLQQLKSKIKLDLGMYITMVDNYLPMFTIPDIKKQKEIQESTLKNIKIISQKIKNKEKLIEKPLLSFARIFTSKPFQNKIKDKDFWVEDNCTSCKICEKVCPVNNITVNKKPVWHGHCEQCYACLHFCPEECIQHGKKTKDKKRFHNPDISIKEIMNQKA